MSNRLVNLVDQARIGNTIAKAILRKIADQSNDLGEGVWSSQEYLAWIVECRRQTANTHCVWLRDKLKVLDWEPRPGATNLYKINVGVLKELAEPYKDREDVFRKTIERVSEIPTTVSEKPTPDVSETDTSPSVVPNEPEIEVIYPNGEPVPPKKICTRCGKAPKAPRAKLYCEVCQAKATAEWENKKAHMAIRSYEQRIKGYYLNEDQVDLIIQAVGDKEADQKRWARYLDHWRLNGWHIGQAGLANVVEAFKTRSMDAKLGQIEQKPAGVPFVDARRSKQEAK